MHFTNSIARSLRSAAVTATALALLVNSGCSSTPKANDKEVATKHWNAARSAVLTSLAKDQYQAGNFDKCRTTVDDALRMTPESEPLHLLSAKLLIEKGQLEQAEKELDLARKYAPNDGEPYYLSGVIYQRWRKPEAALGLYKSAYEKSPAELAYLLAAGEMLVAMDKPQEALDLLAGKIDYFEHSGAIRDAAGQILLQLGKLDEAVSMFRTASILSETDETIRERLAKALLAHKDYREGIDVLTRLLQSEGYAKRGDLFLALGQCQIEIGKTREARVSFETATQLDATSAAAWRGLGRAALEIGDYKRAELSLTRATKLDGGHAETQLLMGYVQLRQNRLAEALKCFQAAAAIDREDTMSLCMIGYVLEKMGRSDEAASYYGKALRIKPGDNLASQLMAGVDPNE